MFAFDYLLTAKYAKACKKPKDKTGSSIDCNLEPREIKQKIITNFKLNFSKI
jgi:hypothetical protein